MIKLENSLKSFYSWLDVQGCSGYDPYDLWATGYGVFARSIYYRNRKLGSLLALPLVAADIVLPQIRYIGIQKKFYATSDAQIILALLNLYAIDSKVQHLEKAKIIAERLLQNACTGYVGRGYGYPFDWQNNRGLWKAGTPYITVSPYCFEAFLKLYDVTNDIKYKEAAGEIVTFALDGLNKTVIDDDKWASSYSPIDQSKIINASAYRSYVLAKASQVWNNSSYKEASLKFAQFVVYAQSQDGSWVYAYQDEYDSFVDHFHTCFVLKNLFKANMVLQSQVIDGAIKKGYGFYSLNLYDANGFPKPFYGKRSSGLVQYEMYDWAEAISLGVLLGSVIPGAIEVSQRLANEIMEKYQHCDGHFTTKVYKGGYKHFFPFIRWPQAQMFYALTNLLVSNK